MTELVDQGRDQGRLAGRLQAARQRAFVGRKEELAAFDEALCGGGRVLFVHGPAGAGKSALLSCFARRAEETERTVVLLDGRLLAETTSVSERVVLLIDNFEPRLESWFRERFLPSLPDGALVVVAGRTPPDLSWRADPGWADLLQVIGLGDLEPMDADALLDARGVAGELRDSLLTFAGGHPLALSLGAAHSGWTPAVVATLLDRLVGDVPSSAHRHALEVCAHTYRATQDLLRAALPDEDTAELFSWLRRLPFVESRPFGLCPRDIVRRVIDADLRWRDPQGYADLHRRVNAHLTRRIRDADDADVLGAVASLFFPHRNETRTPHVWHGESELYEDVFHAEDAGDLLALTTDAGVVAHWMARQPQAFRLYRHTANGELAGACAWLRVESEAEAQADPVVAAAWASAHVHAPLRRGEHLAVYRSWVRERTSPVTSLIQWRAVGWFLRAERVAWSFIAVRGDDPASGHYVRYYDMRDLGAHARVGDVEYLLPAHDWRAVPAHVWLDGLLSARPHEARREPELAVLAEQEFTDAVRKALRHLSKPGELAASPLTRCGLLAGRANPVAALRELLEDSIRDLGRDPRAGKPHRALDVTYLRGAPTQEAAAERLGLSFSTYRRHLAAGIDRICEDLWHREVSRG